LKVKGNTQLILPEFHSGSINKKECSKQRQKLWAKLRVWLQREKDMTVAQTLGVQGVPEKLVFIRQEQTKLRREIAKLGCGVRKQRKWSSGGYV
jgi:hypothetical protein